LLNSAATERATISEVPPGAKGTTKRIALEGQADWAKEGRARLAAPAPAACKTVRRESKDEVMGSPEGREKCNETAW
jgi:hypothetical protein